MFSSIRFTVSICLYITFLCTVHMSSFRNGSGHPALPFTARRSAVAADKTRDTAENWVKWTMLLLVAFKEGTNAREHS